MTFEAGKSGNPNGRPPSKKAFSDALNRAIKRAKVEGGPCALERIADRLVNEALTSEAPLPAIREIADRLDGKPAQSIGNTSPDEAFRVLVGWMSDRQEENG